MLTDKVGQNVAYCKVVELSVLGKLHPVTVPFFSWRRLLTPCAGKTETCYIAAQSGRDHIFRSSSLLLPA